MVEADRPTPEQMLARIKSDGEGDDAAPRKRGRLKVFFGYAAGVGKTYAMLSEARRLKEAGVDVVAGYVEPHGRPETEALLDSLERLPTLTVPHRGATLREFDLDAALARNPAVILVDELAHSNAPGVRHAKRWQDVEELLALGIDVLTTVNVQHVESLNDVVAQVSGVTVRETVPDEVINLADEVALIDLSPEDLLERLRQGKVYIPAQAERALLNFFKRENLVALRELALRRTADRVHADVQSARLGAAATAPWAISERLLVCVGPAPSSAKVVRAAKRLADSLRAEWTAAHVETPGVAALPDADRQRLASHLRLAERLGAETVTLAGTDPAAETIAYAGRRNVTKIVVGKSVPRGRWPLLRRSLVDRLIRDSGDVDVYVIRGAEEPTEAVPSLSRRGAYSWRPWLATVAVIVACTAVGLAFDAAGLSETNVVMAYLLGVAYVATRYGRGPSVAASVLGVLAFDVLFVLPYYTVAVSDTQYVVTFAVMLLIGLLISTLAGRVRRQADLSRRNAEQTETLYRLARTLTGLSGQSRIIGEAERTVADVFAAEAAVFVPEDGTLRPVVDHPARFAADASEVAVAQWVFDRGRMAGRGTDTLPSAKALHVPLATPNGVVGVLAVRHDDPDRLLVPETRRLLETSAAQIALAVERDRLVEQAQMARVEAEAERLRGTLLAAVSHDLRTPLAAIAGAASGLLERGDRLDEPTRRELLETIADEADRLTRLVENLLRLTQLTARRMEPETDWHPIDDVIGSALGRVSRLLGERAVTVDVPSDLPLVRLDPVLVEQALINLLENAVRYGPADGPIDVRAFRDGNGISVEVADRGPGLFSGDEQRVFEAFYRGRTARPDRRGAGLGLAIVRAVAEAHGGAAAARNRPDGGAAFTLSLPAAESPPAPVAATVGAARDE